MFWDINIIESRYLIKTEIGYSYKIVSAHWKQYMLQIIVEITLKRESIFLSIH